MRQRADRYNAIGKPKSESGERTVPLTPIVANTLREWKLACPKSEQGLVFPLDWRHCRKPHEHHQARPRPGADRRRVTVTEKAAGGAPVVRAKYTGLHALRHFYVSWCINRRATAASSYRRKWCKNG